MCKCVFEKNVLVCFNIIWLYNSSIGGMEGREIGNLEIYVKYVYIIVFCIFNSKGNSVEYIYRKFKILFFVLFWKIGR